MAEKSKGLPGSISNERSVTVNHSGSPLAELLVGEARRIAPGIIAAVAKTRAEARALRNVEKVMATSQRLWLD
jgi:hypothetical protein